jgi:glycosyltransferase involved in cell wall biosynthesis
VLPDPGPGKHRGGDALFVGRLSSEKGIETLIRAWERLSTQVPLWIVGDGPLASYVAQAAGRLSGIDGLGRRPASDIYDLMGDARAVIASSELYETFGRVVIEAYAKGTPVIGANIEAIGELIEPGRTGLLFSPG